LSCTCVAEPPVVFQSTLPQGERREETYIHQDSASFQSTLPQGERRRASMGWMAMTTFQSTLPQGERLGAGVVLFTEGDFNPRSRRGSD